MNSGKLSIRVIDHHRLPACHGCGNRNVQSIRDHHIHRVDGMQEHVNAHHVIVVPAAISSPVTGNIHAGDRGKTGSKGFIPFLVLS